MLLEITLDALIRKKQKTILNLLGFIKKKRSPLFFFSAAIIDTDLIR